MESINIREKLFAIITEFEDRLKKVVGNLVREKHGIELTSPLLKSKYPCLKKHKYLREGLNIDIAVLCKVVRKEIFTFCPDPGGIFR